MVNFNINLTNTSIEELSKKSYQHNILDLQGCRKKFHTVPGYLAKFYINPLMFSLEFNNKVKETISRNLNGPVDKWWASRPIDLDWNKLCGENGIAIINKECIKSLETQKNNNNLLFTLSSIEKNLQIGGNNLNFTDSSIKDHINASSEKSTDIISSKDIYFILGRFQDWTKKKEGSFPKLLILTFECYNENEKDKLVKPNTKEILLNYIQHIAEQFKCEKIKCDFLKNVTNYGFDDKGIKTCSKLTKKFMDIPGVCPTPELKPEIKAEIKPENKAKGKAIDLTTELEKKEKQSIEKTDNTENLTLNNSKEKFLTSETESPKDIVKKTDNTITSLKTKSDNPLLEESKGIEKTKDIIKTTPKKPILSLTEKPKKNNNRKKLGNKNSKKKQNKKGRKNKSKKISK